MSLLRCCGRVKSTTPEQSPSKPKRRKPKDSFTFTLLLLGTEGSGKSTFIRQMEVIHGKGFNEEKRMEFVPDILRNIFEAMEILTDRIKSLKIDLGDSSRERDILILLDNSTTVEQKLLATSLLWADTGIQECYRRREEYSTSHRLGVSTKYFMSNLERIREYGYIPITEDIFRVRTQTVGVRPHDFVVSENNIPFKIVDVGGQREERDRWISFLTASTTCVIFLTALDEYDSYFLETIQDVEVPRNRLQESVELFQEISQGYEWMDHTTFILFLNKDDLYREKISTSHIANHFPEYQGFQGNIEDGKSFILEKFRSTNSGSGRRRTIYSHYTCATDTENVKFVFTAVKDTVLQINLVSSK